MKKVLKTVANITLWTLTAPIIVLLGPIVLVSWLFVMVIDGIRNRLLKIPLINEVIDSDPWF